MAETKKPVEEVTAADAEAMFASAAKALGGNRARPAGFRRVSIPVDEPIRPEPLPTTKAAAEPVVIAPAEEPSVASPSRPQSSRKAWYLKRREEEEELEAAEAEAPVIEEAEEEEYDRGYDFAATTVIPSAVTFDYGYEEEDVAFDDDGEYEYTQADIEEEVAFTALEEALSRHADVYGDPRQSRSHRYHDYGFGMGISFDGPSYFDEEDDEI